MTTGNPYTVTLILVAVTTLVLAGYAYRARAVPGAVQFAVLCIGITIWTGANAFRIGETEFSTFRLLANVEWVGILLVGPAWLLFTLSYTGHRERISGRLLALLAVQPVVTLPLVFTNGRYHTLFRTVNGFEPAGPGLAAWDVTHNVAYWAAIVYVYCIVFVGSIVLIRLSMRAPQLYRGRMSALLVAVVAPALGTIPTLLDARPIEGLSMGPLSFSLSVVALAVALFGHRLFGVVPISPSVVTDAVVEEMTAGVIVLDAQGRIAETNPAADRVLDASDPTGASVEAIQPNLAAVLDDDGEDKLLLDDVAGRERYVTVEATPVHRASGLLVGRLVTLHDVTDRVLREQRLDVLNRVLRHNVRHETNIILGHGDLLDDGLDAEDRIHLAAMCDAAEKLVDWSDRARYVERALDDVAAKRRDIPVGATIDRAVERVRERHPNATIVTPVSATQEVLAHTTLEWALYELIENGVEHNDSTDPAVTVSVDATPTAVTISIADTGPGLPPEERRVVESGEETPLEHGSGLGLWLVNWTVRAVGCQIDFAENDPRGTVVHVTLTRAS
ncbi:histidine kinase N-terminal 7TM domain-containing protein [Haloarchaeobius sp. DFWS5]|uniref:histidine kinase N-terminal 7TM domain-containing protein n=1 Tax=Haloarchaeobius sp. DFWS5 TaxID=3446114 RepID=UPI003EBCCACC